LVTRLALILDIDRLGAHWSRYHGARSRNSNTGKRKAKQIAPMHRRQGPGRPFT
jgi:hypothetical protein